MLDSTYCLRSLCFRWNRQMAFNSTTFEDCLDHFDPQLPACPLRFQPPFRVFHTFDISISSLSHCSAFSVENVV
jgi:hypothetical protein